MLGSHNPHRWLLKGRRCLPAALYVACSRSEEVGVWMDRAFALLFFDFGVVVRSVVHRPSCSPIMRYPGKAQA